MKNLILIPVFLLSLGFGARGERPLPAIGAHVFVEHWHTPEQVESFFRTMNRFGMTMCRMHLFETDLHRPDGTWDFSRMDHAFRMAEKYGVGVFATFSPVLGGYKFPVDESHLTRSADYIDRVVNHFKGFGSLYGWLVCNEPGTGGIIPDTEFVNHRFDEWKKMNTRPTTTGRGFPRISDFEKKEFLVYLNTWYLDWLAREVRRHDPGGHIHVNSHNIFENVAEYDFPAWQKFLSSSGVSAHPSWHFGFFDRSRYTMALSANNEIVRAGAGALPYWVTELQGGANIQSGTYPFCPTGEEVTQWLWTSVATGAEGILFWCLNPKAQWKEAGEWALLDFHGDPTDRLSTAGDVTRCLDHNNELFRQAKPVDSPISIVYIRESLWTEGKTQPGNRNEQYEGRFPGGSIKSSVAFYEVLAENGIKSRFMEFNEYDWDREDQSGQCVILANQLAIPERYWPVIDDFVGRGGKLIAEGLTGFYDENTISLHATGFPLEHVFGASLSEVKTIPGDFYMPFGTTRMPAHLWKGYIHNISANVLAEEGGNITATHHRYGKGEVVWIPSLFGLGAVRTGDKTPLSTLLRRALANQIAQLPVIFNTVYSGALMETLATDDGYITVFINKDTGTKAISLETAAVMPEVIFSGKGGGVDGKTVTIQPEETIVIYWKNS